MKQTRGADEENGVAAELQNLREQLERTEGERKGLDTQLAHANTSVTQLQEEGSSFVKKALVKILKWIVKIFLKCG